MSTEKHVTETICTGVALYGFKPDSNQLEQLYRLLVDWFNAHDCMPTELAVGSPGFSKGFVGFSRADKRLRKAGFETVDSFELRLLQTGELARSVCQVMIDCDSGSFALVVLKSISRLDDTFLEELVRPVCQLAQPVYGIAYYRDIECGAIWYGLGVASGREDDEAVVKERKNWNGVLVYDKLGDGYIRDVYHWNFLTDLQLQQPVGEQTLREWIQQEPGRGTLTELTKEVMFWKVPERQRVPLRSELDNSGLFFDRDKFHTDLHRTERKQEPMPFFEQSMKELVKLQKRLRQAGQRRSSAVAAICVDYLLQYLSEVETSVAPQVVANCRQLLQNFWTAFQQPRSTLFAKGLKSLSKLIEDLQADSTNAAVEEAALSVRDLYQFCSDRKAKADVLPATAIEHAYRGVFEAACQRANVEILNHVLHRIEAGSTDCQAFIYYAIAALEVVEDMEESDITQQAMTDAIAELQAEADDESEE